jgi:hypothetical protein
MSVSRPVRLEALLRGETGELQRWLSQPDLLRIVWAVTLIVAGAGLFGAVVGGWRSELQAAYSALKLPLILLITAAGNTALNGLLAPLLGIDLKLRQSFLAVLMSFVLAAVILASLAPVLAFLVWNLPNATSPPESQRHAFALLQVAAVGAVAIAGVAANLRLYQGLRELAGSVAPARRLLIAWLATNLLLGAQLSWIARPFFGQPDLEVVFLRDDAFRSNFFEALAYNFRQLLSL